MQTSIQTNRTIEGNRTERVTTQGVELLISVTTLLCSDGVMRDMADPFVQVEENGVQIPLALSNQAVSEQGIEDAVLAALTPNQFA